MNVCFLKITGLLQDHLAEDKHRYHGQIKLKRRAKIFIFFTALISIFVPHINRVTRVQQKSRLDGPMITGIQVYAVVLWPSARESLTGS